MTVYEKGLVTILVADALFVLLSIPLALGKVGPNAVYGYRTRATLSDETLWYAANAYFARAFVVCSLASAAAALFLARPEVVPAERFLTLSVVLLGAPVAVAGVLTSRFVARFGNG